MSVRGLLFDKDGTLIDFAQTWIPAYREIAMDLANGDEGRAGALMAAGGHDAATGVILSGTVLAGGTNHEIAGLWAPMLELQDRDRLADRLDIAFRQHASESLVPVTDLPALFARLRRRGLELGVATNDSTAAGGEQLRRLGAADLLDFFTGYDGGHGAKPAPGMVFGFCEAVGLAPAEVAVIGDSPHDLDMALAAGAGLRIGVLTGASPAEVLAPLADHVLGSIAELESVLAT